MKTVTQLSRSKPTPTPSTYVHCHCHVLSIGRITGRADVKANGERGAKDRPGMPGEDEGGWDGDGNRLLRASIWANYTELVPCSLCGRRWLGQVQNLEHSELFNFWGMGKCSRLSLLAPLRSSPALICLRPASLQLLHHSVAWHALFSKPLTQHPPCKCLLSSEVS